MTVELEDWQLEALGDAGAPLLPPGRWALTAAELHRLAVEAFPESRTRRDLWDRFKRTRTVLRHVAREIWVGGSFVSTKLNPKDIDLLALLWSDRLHVPRHVKREHYMYAVGPALGVDLTAKFDDDATGLDSWQRWIQYGKPYLRTAKTTGRGVAIVPIAD